MEDGIKGEGVCSLEEAKAMADRLVINEDGFYVDPEDSRSSEEIIFSAIESIKAVMTKEESQYLRQITRAYEQLKKAQNAQNN